jgi:hypothetical protein
LSDFLSDFTQVLVVSSLLVAFRHPVGVGHARRFRTRPALVHGAEMAKSAAELAVV